MKGYRATTLLLVVLVALAALVYGLEGQSSTATPTKTSQPTIWTMPQEQVVGLTMTGAGKSLALAKDSGGQWQLSAPVTGPADEWLLSSVIYAATQLQADSIIAERDYDLATFGLDQPALNLQLQLDGGKQATLLVGSQNPRGTGRYVTRADGGAVYLLSASVVSQFEDLLENPPLATPTPSAEATPAGTPAR